MVVLDTHPIRSMIVLVHFSGDLGHMNELTDDYFVHFLPSQITQIKHFIWRPPSLSVLTQ